MSKPSAIRPGVAEVVAWHHDTGDHQRRRVFDVGPYSAPARAARHRRGVGFNRRGHRAHRGGYCCTETLRDSLLHGLLTRGVPGWHSEWKDVPGIGTIPADWEVVRLREVIPRFDYGTSVQCNSDPSGIPVLRIPNIASGELDLSDLKYASLSSNEIAKLHLDAGDILLVRTNGNPEICGRSWVTGGLEGQWAFASYLVRGRPDSSRVNPAFVGRFLKSDAGHRLLRGHIRTSAGNYNLSVGELGSILLPCPPLAEQARIVDSVSSNTDLIEDLRVESGRLNLAKTATADALLSGKIRVRNG